MPTDSLLSCFIQLAPVSNLCHVKKLYLSNCAFGCAHWSDHAIFFWCTYFDYFSKDGKKLALLSFAVISIPPVCLTNWLSKKIFGLSETNRRPEIWLISYSIFHFLNFYERGAFAPYFPLYLLPNPRAGLPEPLNHLFFLPLTVNARGGISGCARGAWAFGGGRLGVLPMAGSRMVSFKGEEIPLLSLGALWFFTQKDLQEVHPLPCLAIFFTMCFLRA